MIPKVTAIAGLVLSLVGFLILFRFGMPYRVETKGAGYLMLEDTDETEKVLDAHYKRLGMVGLVISVVGTFVQAVAVLLV